MAAKRIKLPALGGLSKSVVVNSTSGNTQATTIQGFENQIVSLAQLRAALGLSSGQQPTQAGGGGTAALLVGPGLSGGGVLVGAVPLRLIAPIPWFPEEHIFDEPIQGGGGSGGTAGSSTLAGLSDVTISSPATGQVLAYNGTKWANASVPGTTRIVNKGASWVSSVAIVAGSANIVYVNCPMAGTIQGVRVVTSGGPGSCVLDIWKAAFGSFPPLVANSITASAKPTISAGITYNDVTLTGWTTAITAGDVLAFTIVSTSSFTQIEVVLQVAQ